MLISDAGEGASLRHVFKRRRLYKKNAINQGGLYKKPKRVEPRTYSSLCFRMNGFFYFYKELENMQNSQKTMDKIVSLCKQRGFVYPGSEIYGGLANTWDYGPLGVEFKNNVKQAWVA